MLQVHSTQYPSEGGIFLWIKIFGGQNNRKMSHLFQNGRIWNFNCGDIKPCSSVLTKDEGMEQFVFICKAAFSQQQIP